MRVGGEGVAATVAAADEGVDFIIRKNEAIFGWVVGKSCVLIHFEELGGFLEFFLFLFAALGLDFAELVECPFELAGEAMLVRAEVGQCAGLFAERGDRKSTR